MPVEALRLKRRFFCAGPVMNILFILMYLRVERRRGCSAVRPLTYLGKPGVGRDGAGRCRHHASMLVLNDQHTILMTYAVRVGGARNGIDDNFSNSPYGYPYYGIEAIVSTDNGGTWNINKRYVISRWKGNLPLTNPNYCYRSSQSTSTVQLPDGTLLTAYGTGRYRTTSGNGEWFMDTDVVRWKVW